MTITRTPRKWPGYRTHRRMKFAGTHVIRIPEVQDRDFSDIIRGAKIAVEARNNHGWGESRVQRVMHDRDRVDVERVVAESHSAIVVGWDGYRKRHTEHLRIVVQP
jgi:hypothetical protein